MNGQWNWLIGRKLSLGEVVDVFGESATVRHGDDETRVLLCELLEWAAKDVLAMRAEIATMKAEKFEAGNNQTIFMVRISELLQQLAAKDVEIERLKTVPMKYRRMAFNAQLQDENESLRQQLAERDAQIVLLRDGLAMAVSIIGHPDDYGTKHMQKILATTGPKEQEE